MVDYVLWFSFVALPVIVLPLHSKKFYTKRSDYLFLFVHVILHFFTLSVSTYILALGILFRKGKISKRKKTNASTFKSVVTFATKAAIATEQNKQYRKEYWKKQRLKGNPPRNRAYGVEIQGSLLPKQGSLGSITIRFDGKMPRPIGTKGGKRVYKTDGNLQVFFTSKTLENPEHYSFEANHVDIYVMPSKRRRAA